jgi:hypothetical protein
MLDCDWSSDVCSSDLVDDRKLRTQVANHEARLTALEKSRAG